MYIENDSIKQYYYNGLLYTLTEENDEIITEDVEKDISDEISYYTNLLNELLDCIESKKGFKATGGSVPIIASLNDYWIELEFDRDKIIQELNLVNITYINAWIVFTNDEVLKGFQLYIEGEKELTLHINYIFPENRLDNMIKDWQDQFEIE